MLMTLMTLPYHTFFLYYLVKKVCVMCQKVCVMFGSTMSLIPLITSSVGTDGHGQLSATHWVQVPAIIKAACSESCRLASLIHVIEYRCMDA